MSGYKLVISFPSEERLKSAVWKLEHVKKIKKDVVKKVLGHDAVDADWIIFDDMLSRQYDDMKKLLKMLDERAG